MAVFDIEGYDAVFRSVDQDGLMCRYEALFTFADAPGEGARTFLVYADAAADDEGEVATYASLLCDPALLAAAQAAVDAGATPKKPPVIELADIEDDADWALVEEALAQVDAEEED